MQELYERAKKAGATDSQAMKFSNLQQVRALEAGAPYETAIVFKVGEIYHDPSTPTSVGMVPHIDLQIRW